MFMETWFLDFLKMQMESQLVKYCEQQKGAFII